jgi:hypothetical protein
MKPFPILPTALTVALALVVFGGCSKTPVTPVGGGVGSETHWLSACTADADCAEAVGSSCVCGLCTVTCVDDAACGSAAGRPAVCVDPTDPALVQACGAAAPSAALCLGTCASDAECGAGAACDGGRCLPGADADTDAGAPGPRVREQNVVVPARPKMDVLVVVDNSGSMCEEQGQLAAALRTAAGASLTEPDLRFAVTSTDLRTETDRGAFLVRPAIPQVSPNCPSAGGPNAPDEATCDAALAAVDVRDGVLRAESGLPTETLAAAASCLVTLGTMGDGFEKGLEAMRRALSCDGPQRALYGECCRDGVFDPTCTASPAFLRPDAALLVVLLSDEPDCSDPAANPAASRRAICRHGPDDGADADTLPDAFADPTLCPEGPEACAAAECGALAPEACHAARCVIDRGDNGNCVWHDETLTPVGDYVDFLRSLKPRGALDVRVLPLVGPSGRLASGEPLTWTPGQPAEGCDPSLPDFDAEADAARCCPDGLCTGQPFALCSSENGRAYTGRRYRELGQAFCDDAADCEALDAVAICDDGFELGASIDRLLLRLQRVFCLDVEPADGETLEVRRDDVALAPADFGVEDAPDCPTGRALRLLDPAPGATYTVRLVP